MNDETVTLLREMRDLMLRTDARSEEARQKFQEWEKAHPSLSSDAIQRLSDAERRQKRRIAILSGLAVALLAVIAYCEFVQVITLSSGPR